MLVTEVDARLQQGLHGYDVRCHSVLFLQIRFSLTSGGFIPSANRLRHRQKVDAPCGMLKYNTTTDLPNASIISKK